MLIGLVIQILFDTNKPATHPYLTYLANTDRDYHENMILLCFFSVIHDFLSD